MSDITVLRPQMHKLKKAIDRAYELAGDTAADAMPLKCGLTKELQAIRTHLAAASCGLDEFSIKHSKS